MTSLGLFPPTAPTASCLAGTPWVLGMRPHLLFPLAVPVSVTALDNTLQPIKAVPAIHRHHKKYPRGRVRPGAPAIGGYGTTEHGQPKCRSSRFSALGREGVRHNGVQGGAGRACGAGGHGGSAPESLAGEAAAGAAREALPLQCARDRHCSLHVCRLVALPPGDIKGAGVGAGREFPLSFCLELQNWAANV